MNLLEGYASLPAKLREQYPLVLAGKKGWNSEGIDQRVQELLEEGNSILTTGFVDDEDLPALLKAANLLLWPSIHEGFGLPILEAMAAGTPVVTSDLAPMNRLGEDAALFVTPDKPVTITSAAKRVLESPKLAKEMAKKGKLVAKKHRWDVSASLMLDLINKLSEANE
jgi:alpha-1,3-rhamnosyl/mannosyltransferase